MDRLRHSIATTDFRDNANGFEGRITISVGSAIFPDDSDAAERLIYCADMALLRSKAMGRNRSTIYDAALFEQTDTNI
jgi:diguanylate cyclase (GGDEF)-like protein